MSVPLTIYIQQLLCTVIKFYVVKEAKQGVLWFLQDFQANFDRGLQSYSLIYSLLTAKCIDLPLLIDYSTFFKDVIHYSGALAREARLQSTMGK